MKVAVASTAMPVLPNHVYVIPPDADLLINDYAFTVVSPRSRRNAQVDLFFGSLAEAVGERAIGVVVSGYDGDACEIGLAATANTLFSLAFRSLPALVA